MRYHSTRKKQVIPPLLILLPLLFIAALCLWGACSLGAHFSASGKTPRQNPIGTPAPKNTALSKAVPKATPFSASTPSEEELLEKISSLQENFPEGAYWNHLPEEPDDPFAITYSPCDHAAFGDTCCHHYGGATEMFFPFYQPLSQCLAFASFLSDQLFGEDAPIAIHRSFSQLKLGDHIRLTGEEHSMIVVKKEESQVTVAEVNSDYQHCQISWSRMISQEELEALGEEVEYLTRYPQSLEGP